MLSKGQKINDRYEIIKTIGEGGMANVYLANDLILDRKDYLYVDSIDDGIVGVLENGDEEIIPYKQMNLDYIPLIKKSYSRPTLKIDKSKIFKVELDLSLPKKELRLNFKASYAKCKFELRYSCIFYKNAHDL